MYFFSVYSGLFYELKESDYSNLDDGQLPLTKPPQTSCKKCHGRGFVGFSAEDYTYPPCKCVIKNLNNAMISSKFNIKSQSV